MKYLCCGHEVGDVPGEIDLLCYECKKWSWRHPKLTEAAVKRSVKSVLGMAAAFEKMKKETGQSGL